MISFDFHSLGESMAPSSLVTAVVGLFMLLGFLTFKSVSSDDILPGVPELKGVPILGALPVYLKLGAPQLLVKLIALGDNGISYARVVNKFIVSVHDPAMIREVLSYSGEFASRYRAFPSLIHDRRVDSLH